MNATQIKQRLSISMPESLAFYLDNTPFGEDSFVHRNGLVYLHDMIVKKTEFFRSNGFFDKEWPHTYLAIGGDGLGNEYFIDTKKEDSPVFLAEHENSGSLELVFIQSDNSLDEWVTAMKSTEENPYG